MAGQIKGITIQFNGETTKLDKALREINKNTKSLDKELGQINNALKFNPTNVELWRQKQEVLTQKVAETKSKLDVLKQAQKQLDAEGVEKTSEEYRHLERQIIVAENQVKNFEGQLRKVGNVKMKALSAQFEQVGDKMKQTGKTMSQYVTAPIAAGFGVAVKTTMDFDTAMSQVAATMGATTQDMEKTQVSVDGFKGSLRELAVEMGSKTAFTATQAAEALNYMALAGYDAQTSAEMLPKVLSLAAAGGMELAEASDMITDSQSALGLSLDETTVLIDQMAKASSKTNTSVSQLGEGILTVGGTAKMMKGGTAELAQVLGLLADNGIKGSEGGTALRNILLSLSAPTDKASGFLAELGVSAFDAEGNMRSMKDVMTDLESALAGLSSEEERTWFIANIFNKRDLKSVNALLGTSVERWDEVAAAIGGAEGAAAQMADTQLDNLGGSLTILQSALEGLAIHVGDVLTPYIKQFAEWITALTDKFNGLSPTAQKVVVVLGAIAAAIGPMLLVGGVLLSSLGQFLIWLPKLVSAFSLVTKGVGLLSGAFTFMTGPIGIAIAAIAAAIAIGVLLYKNWDKIKAFAVIVKDAVVNAFTAMKNGIVSAFTAIGNIIKAAAITWFNLMTWPYRKAWEFIKLIADKIKKVFNFEFKMPKIKLPHFSIKPKGWKVGDLLKGSIPTLGIDWYKDGAIFTRPTIIGNKGFGEAGAEAALPLDVLWDQMNGMFMRMSDSIVNGVGQSVAIQTAGMGGTIVVENYLYPSGPKMGEITVNTYDEYKKKLG